MMKGYFWNILGFCDGSIFAKVNVVEELKALVFSCNVESFCWVHFGRHRLQRRVIWMYCWSFCTFWKSMS